jgi:hypothetical protein
MKTTPENQVRWERWVIAFIGLVLMVLFQNFTNSDSEKVKREIFSEKTVLVDQATLFLSFVEGEDVSKMTDGELVSRLRDGMLTQAEILSSDLEQTSSEGLKAERQNLVDLAHSLAFNPDLRSKVVARARSVKTN